MADFTFNVPQSSLNRDDHEEISPGLPCVKFFLDFFFVRTLILFEQL